jgi:hypothetical protein
VFADVDEVCSRFHARSSSFKSFFLWTQNGKKGRHFLRTKMEKEEEGKEEEKRIDAPLFIFSLICALLFFSVILGSFVKFPTAGSRVVYDRTHKLHSAHDVHFSSHHHHHHE